MKSILRGAVLGVLLAAGGAILPSQAEVAPGDTVGGFVRVTGKVSGGLPNHAAKPKEVKSPALYGEEIVTDASGTASISFIDRSHLFISKGSQIVIDKFVFNPKTGQEVAHYTLKDGAIRLISGSIKGDALRINTPNATLVVRGTNVKIGAEDGRTVVSVNEGQVEVRADGGHETVTLRAGQHTEVDHDGVHDPQSGAADVGDDSVDDPALDGEPDLPQVDLAELGFSEQEISDIEDGIAEAESEDGDVADSEGDADSGDGDSGDSGDSDSGDSGDGGDSGGDGGGDGGGGDGGGGGE